MCFGVRDAIALALKENEAAPLTVLGDLVHNETVLAGLRAEGIEIKQAAAEIETGRVMITAHGASQLRMNEVRRRGLNVLEATCPLVKVAHDALAELVQSDFHPVIIGRRDHVEVRGMTEDLAEFDMVLTEADVNQVRERARFGVMAQTTQPIDKAQRLTALLRQRFPKAEFRFIDTVCRPTKQRQTAAAELARNSDAVVVIGGANSNNTRELVATCQRHCARVHHVQDANGLRADWFADARTVGITAGTSTPDSVIAAVEAWLRTFAAEKNQFRKTIAAELRAG